MGRLTFSFFGGSLQHPFDQRIPARGVLLISLHLLNAQKLQVPVCLTGPTVLARVEESEQLSILLVLFPSLQTSMCGC